MKKITRCVHSYVYMVSEVKIGEEGDPVVAPSVNVETFEKLSNNKLDEFIKEKTGYEKYLVIGSYEQDLKVTMSVESFVSYADEIDEI